VNIIHRGRYKTMANQQRSWLRRRQAIEPTIGHTKHDHGMKRCWFKDQAGDAMHAVLCAAGFNIRWLLRAIARMGVKAPSYVFITLRLVLAWAANSALGCAKPLPTAAAA
jgi:transposase, IS5 family